MAAVNIAFRAQLVVPEQRQLYDYWIDKASGRSMPDRCDIHPMHFPRLLPNISLIEIDPQTSSWRIRLAGTRLRDVYDREITGLDVSEIDFGDRRDYWMAAYQRTIEEGKPTQGVIRGPRVNKEHLVQYWLKLPLGRAGCRGVGMLLCFDYFQSASEEAALLPQAMA